MKTEAIIDLAALKKNAKCLRSFLGEFYAVLKCDAYGHGLYECAKALYDVGQRLFAVYSLDEALLIRTAAPDGEVLILGRTEPRYAEILASERFVQTVFSGEYAKEIAPRSENLRVHIKIDCGMNRCGFRESSSDIKRAFSDFKGKIEGVYTHFPCADGADITLTERQLENFLLTANELEGLLGTNLLKHSAASAAAIRMQSARLDCSRIGLALYGTLPDNCNLPFEICPVMSLISTVIHVKEVKKGEKIGYGAKEQVKRNSVVATVSCGYANGLNRVAGSNLRPRINGCPCKILGNICMDRCMLDVTDIFGNGKTVNVGDRVIFFDNAAAFADAENTISYEVLTRVGKMNKRTYKS